MLLVGFIVKFGWWSIATLYGWWVYTVELHEKKHEELKEEIESGEIKPAQ